MRELMLLAAAGAMGAVSRHAVSGWALRSFGDRFAVGTLLVNVVGSFLLGVLMQVGLGSDWVPRAARSAIAVGFLGAFTTFSTFSYETIRMVEQGAWGVVAANVVAQLVLGLGAAWLGIVSGRLIFF